MGDLRIGVVGVGGMGRAHAEVWGLVEGAVVVGVCDDDSDRVNTAADAFGCLAFGNVEEMCVSGLIDVVDICTPSGLHADQALIAAQHGMHVLVEKPIDLNIAKVDKLILECQDRGLTLGCVFQRRTFPGLAEVKRSIDSGEMGSLISCSGYLKWFRPQSYYDSADWRGTWAMDGGVLANQAVHALDQMCWLAGRVTEVEYASLTTDHMMEAEDNALVVLKFESGARGMLEATTRCSPDLGSRVEIYGTKGSAAFEDATVVKFGIDGEDRMNEIEQPEERIGGGSLPMAIGLQGHQRIFEDFVDAVNNNRPPLVTGEQGKISLEALTMIYAKAFPGLVLGTP